LASGILFIILGTVAIVLFGHIASGAIEILIGLAFGAVFLVLVHLLRVRDMVSYYDMDDIGLTIRTFADKRSLGSVSVSWADVISVDETRDFIVMNLKDGTSHQVPLNCFDDRRMHERFLNLARRHEYQLPE
jgi:hypothetical protein